MRKPSAGRSFGGSRTGTKGAAIFALSAHTILDARRTLNLRELLEGYIYAKDLLLGRMDELRKLGLENTDRYKLLRSMYVDVKKTIREIKRWL